MAIFERQYLAVLTHGLREYPGVGEGLRRLRAAGFKLACVTNKPGKFTEPLLMASGLRPYFDLVVSGDTTARGKPDPMPLFYTAKAFGVRPEDMLLVGDSANDFEAARAAGCRIFLVPYGYNEGRDATALPADAIVPGLVEAAELIENRAA
jgi:phosphoglycolate phosphatase